MKRKIAAIIAADVVGYSTQIARDEEGTLRRLQASRAVFDEFVIRYDGRIFNTAGDSVLAEFSSAVEAVRCALEIQESLRTKNLALPEQDQMQFRIGINLGDVVERDGDLLGDGVNIAARLEALSAPGGICISRSIHEQVQNKISITFADLGPQTVKNIPTPIHAYAANAPDVALRPAMARPARPLALAAAVSGLALIAVASWALLRSSAPEPVRAVGTPAATAAVAKPTTAAAEPAAPSDRPAEAPQPGAAGPPQPAGPSAAPQAPSTASVEYPVTMSCERLPWTKGTLFQEASLRVTGPQVEFSRPIHWPDRNGPLVGTEFGKGQVGPDGEAVVEAGWGSLQNSYVARYTGKISKEGGTLKGNQDWTREGRKYVRACELALRRK